MDQKKLISRKNLSAPPEEHLEARLDFLDLSPREQAVLHATYGNGEVVAVEPLSEWEAPQFTQEGSAFHIHFQTLYKVKGNLDPSRLAEAVRDMEKDEEFLRVNYCTMGKEVRKIILSHRKNPPGIICQDLAHLKGEDLENTLRRVVEADMRQEFDLRRDALFRLSCFRTREEEYAVLATVSHAIAHCFDPRDIFRRINRIAREPGSPRRGGNTAAGQFHLNAEDLPPISVLPYERPSGKPYRQASYRFLLPANVSHMLERRFSDNLLLPILSYAWGLLLLEGGKLRDAWIPLLVSDKDTAQDAFRILSVHPRSTSDISMEKILAAQAAQIEEDMRNHGLPLEHLSTGHFLSFYDFFREDMPYSSAPALPEGNVIFKNLWAAQGTRLAVYFHRRGDDIHMTFLYDENRFKPYGIVLLAKRYVQTLQQMAIDWKQPLSAFHQRELLSAEEKISISLHPIRDGRNNLFDILSGTKLLEDVEIRVLKQNIGNPRFVACSMGDRIPREDTDRNFILLLKGTAARNIATGSGLYNFLDIQKAGSWLNETSFLPGNRARLSIEILSEDASLLYVPIDEMNRLMNEEPAIQRRMMVYALEEMEKYQRLWVQV